MEKILGTDIVTQIGLIVRDIETTAKDYAEFLGQPVPPINPTGTYDKALTQYYGKPTEARAKLAFFHVNQNLDIELIEPDEKDSIWREFLEKRGEGVQHIAFNIRGMKETTAKLVDAGFPLTQKAEYVGGRYAYFNTFDKLKVDIELLENDSDL
ncbi:MAG: VOC family protein [Ruminococcaceae bacterium]|nr:VOC family protein [Oscillospiraceae bacterium]